MTATSFSTSARSVVEKQKARIKSEYREMPGLKLTEAQVRRLWHLDHDTARLVLRRLLEQQFLKRTSDGTFVRATD